MAKTPPDAPEPPDPDNVVPIKARGKRGPMSQTQKANWLAAVRRSNNKRASGIPAGGHVSSEIPAGGPGWGGPAKGPGAPMSKDHPSNPHNIPPETMQEIRRENAEIRARALARIDALIDSKHEGLALQAAIAALNRVEGMPRQSVLTAETTVSEMLGALMDVAKERDAG